MFTFQPVLVQGIIISFDATNWTAEVQLIGSQGNYLQNIQISKALENSANISVGDYCAVLFWEPHNPSDAIVVAVYSIPSAAPSGGGGGGSSFKAPVNTSGGSATPFALGAPTTNIATLNFTLANAQIVKLTWTMDMKFSQAGAGCHVHLADGATALAWGSGSGNGDILLSQTGESQLFTLSADVSLAAGAHSITVGIAAALATGNATLYWWQLSAWFSNT